MALRICDYCGRACIDSGGEKRVALCQSCDEELQGIYMFAWSYLRDTTTDGGRQRKISAARLAEELNVEFKAIDLLIKMGRIQIETLPGEGEGTPEGKRLEILRRIGKGLGRDPKGSDRRR